MSAVGLETFGGPEVLKLVKKPPRALKPGEVLIRVAAAAVNPTDLLLRSGGLATMMAAFAKPYVPGMDAAGVVAAVGEGVTHVAVGDKVMAAATYYRDEGGAQNDQLIVPAAAVAPIPPGASMEEACTLPMNGATAWHALALAAPQGGVVAVTGGAGWLATIILALARERGIRTIADARPELHEEVRANGADVVVDRGLGLSERIRAHAPDGVDGLIDTALIGDSVLPAIRDSGQLVVVRPPAEGGTERGIVRHLAMAPRHMTDQAALMALRELVVDGRLRLRVHETYPPERAADAHRRQEQGNFRGRLVIRF
jgi:NADPH:quinone reductase-like Zn-dependent oxidoreductase